MSLGESVQIAIGVVIGFRIAAFILVRMVRAAAVMINSAERRGAR